MLEEILAAGWEFGKPLLQAGFQRAGEQRAPGPYLQAPGVRQEAAASLYGAPQPGGGLDPKQGGDKGQQLQAAKFIIDSALSLSDRFSQKPEGGQTPGDYAKTMGVTVYGAPKTRATPHGTVREVTVYEPDGSERVELLEPHAFIKDGQKHFGVSHGSASKAGPTTVAPAATPSSGTPFDMPVDIDILTGQDLSFGPIVAPSAAAQGASPLKGMDLMTKTPEFGGIVGGLAPAPTASFQPGSLLTPQAL